MYAVHFRRHLENKNDFVVIAKCLGTLEAAKNARKQSGDLVVHQHNNEVVKSEEWLWDWEKNKENCYAKDAIQKAAP